MAKMMSLLEIYLSPVRTSVYDLPLVANSEAMA